MKDWYHKKLKKVISQAEYDALPEEEKKLCVPARPGKPKPKKQDYEWYEIDEALTRAVASLPFNVFAGVAQLIGYKTPNEDANTAQIQVPGVMAISEILTYGNSEDGTSAINIASKALYTFVRHMNSGRTNYESPDLMIYVMAMSQIYAMISEARKFYKLANTYTYKNKYIPDSIAKACNVDLNSIRNNLADFRYKLNLLTAKVSALCVPEAFNIHKRHAYVMENVFTDSDSLRGQFYVFTPEVYLKWEPTTSETGSSLKSQRPSTVSGVRTNETILADIEENINALIYDEDANIMSGDILKAFGSDGLFMLRGVDEDATVDFVFNEDVLQQIENACCIQVLNSMSYTITQSDTNILTNLTGANSGAGFITTRLFNSHKEDVQAKDVLEWTRLMSWADGNGNYTYGTEIVTRFTIYANGAEPASVSGNVYDVNVSVGDITYSQLASIAAATVFDWHPIMYLFQTTGTNPGYRTFTGDIKKAALVSFEEIKRINDYAVMGSLNSLRLIGQAKANKSF